MNEQPDVLLLKHFSPEYRHVRQCDYLQKLAKIANYRIKEFGSIDNQTFELTLDGVEIKQLPSRFLTRRTDAGLILEGLIIPFKYLDSNESQWENIDLTNEADSNIINHCLEHKSLKFDRVNMTSGNEYDIVFGNDKYPFIMVKLVTK